MWKAQVFHQYSTFGVVHMDWEGEFKTFHWAKFFAKLWAWYYDLFVVPRGYMEQVHDGRGGREEWTDLDFHIWWTVSRTRNE